MTVGTLLQVWPRDRVLRADALTRSQKVAGTIEGPASSSLDGDEDITTQANRGWQDPHDSDNVGHLATLPLAGTQVCLLPISAS
jgi:hypothetical protein